MYGIAEKFYAITNAGGTLTFPASDQFSMYLFSGTATLAAPYTVTADTPTRTTQYTIFYNGNVTTAGANVVSFFGTTLTSQQALAGKLIIIATYKLAAPDIGWKVAILPGTGGYDTHMIQGGFDADNVGDFKVKMGYNGTVTEIYAYNTVAIGAVDEATITPKNNAGATMTGGVITYPLSSVRGTVFTNTVTANNTFVTGDILTFTFAKATANGGAVLLSFKTLRTP